MPHLLIKFEKTLPSKDKTVCTRSLNLGSYIGVLLFLILTVEVYFTLINPYESQKTIRVIDSADVGEEVIKNISTEFKPAEFDYYKQISGVKPSQDIIVSASMQLMKKGDIEDAFYLLKSTPEFADISQLFVNKAMALLEQGLREEYQDFRNFWKSIPTTTRVALWKGKKSLSKSRALSAHLAKNLTMKNWRELKALLPPLLLNVYLMRVYEKIASNDPNTKKISKIFIKNELFQETSYHELFDFGLENNLTSYKEPIKLLNRYLEEKICQPLFLAILKVEMDNYEKDQFYLDSYAHLGDSYLTIIRSGPISTISPSEAWNRLPEKLKFFWRGYLSAECSKEFEIPKIVWERNHFLKVTEEHLNTADALEFIRSFPYFRESLDSFNYSLAEKSIPLIENFLRVPLSQYIKNSLAQDIKTEQNLLTALNWQRYKTAFRLSLDIEQILSAPEIFDRQARIDLAKDFSIKLKLFQRKHPQEQPEIIKNLIAIIDKNRNLTRKK